MDGYCNKDIIKFNMDVNIKSPKTFQEKPSRKAKAETSEQKITFKNQKLYLLLTFDKEQKEYFLLCLYQDFISKIIS